MVEADNIAVPVIYQQEANEFSKQCYLHWTSEVDVSPQHNLNKIMFN